MVERLTNQSTTLNAKRWPRLPVLAGLHTEPEHCILNVTSLGKRAGRDIETASLRSAIARQSKILEDQRAIGIRRVEDFNLVVGNVGLVLETTLIGSCDLFLAIEALNVMNLWVDIFGSRDVSTIISCQGSTLAEIRIVFFKKGLEATCCLLPMNLTMIR